MKGKQEATARDGGGEELGQLTRVFLSCQRTDLTPRQLGLLEELSKEILFICVLENGPAGVRTMGWERGALAGRQAIRRLEESGDCEEQRARREEKRKRNRGRSKQPFGCGEERGHLSSRRPSLPCEMRIR